MRLIHLQEGWRIFFNSWYAKRKGFTQFSGHAQEICQQIVNGCWNGQFFQTSISKGNFPQFWTRDFNWCCKSLIELGYKEKVKQTLDYALGIFEKHDQVTTTITPKNKPYDVYTYAVDSLPGLVNSLKTLGDTGLLRRYRSFLEKEALKFSQNVVEKETGLVKRKIFSSMKDYSKRKSSCYDNCQAAFLSKNLKYLEWLNPLKKYDYPQLIKEQFWNGHFFYDDLDKRDYVASDANLFPFVLGIFDDKEMMKLSLEQIQLAKLDQPFPLKYTNHNPEHFIWQEMVVRNYERDTLWQHMAPLYLKLVKMVDPDKFEEYYRQMTQLIEKHKNYLEVFNPDGTLFKSPFYQGSQGMLWAANYLTLKD